jgi:pseudaminic acid cytidylyltransferase
MSTIAIIPARGGSKRIPRKNIKPFLGKPILAYAVQTALAAKCFEEVMVSTDDPEIAEIARQFGANVPFLRSSTTAHDTATTLEVLREVIAGYRSAQSSFDALCCIYPTAALTEPDCLRNGYAKLLADPSASCALPVVEYGTPIQRAFFKENERIRLAQPEHCLTRSQDLPKAYHDAGQWYWIRTDALSNPEFQILGPASVPIVVDIFGVQDIDTETDWRLAEMKFTSREQNRSV